MVPVAPIVTGITFVLYIPHTLYFYCKASFVITLLLLLLLLLLLFTSNRGRRKDRQKKGQRKERMFKQKCRPITPDIHLQNLNIPTFIISSHSSTFRQGQYTCIQSVYMSCQLDTLGSNFSNYLYSFRMHYSTRNIATTTPLDSHYNITESQVQALIFNGIYKLKRHVHVWDISLCRLLARDVNA
jgi:hypothetical protein